MLAGQVRNQCITCWDEPFAGHANKEQPLVAADNKSNAMDPPTGNLCELGPVLNVILFHQMAILHEALIPLSSRIA